MHSEFEYHFYNRFNAAQLVPLIAIDQQYFPYPWARSSWEELVNSVGEYCLGILQLDGKMIGFSLYLLSSHESLAHLLKICILPEARGRGLAQKLLTNDRAQLVAASFERGYLEVAEHNLSAISTYIRCGYHQIHRQRNYYSDGSDALIMELTF